MTATIVSFRWLDLLEKEFDKSFVDLDLIFGEVEDVDEGEWSHQVRTKLGSLSSCFAQLAHKAQTIFQANAKLEAELVNLRHELIENEALYNISKEENHEMLMKLHSCQLQLHKQHSIDQETVNDYSDSEIIKERLEKQLQEERLSRLSLEVPRQELVLLRRENEILRKQLLSLQGELTGAKLTSKYLDKELAGRIQQLQLLSRELRGEQHERLWRQLEAEIHLHRHKTVVRACRTNNIRHLNEQRCYVNATPSVPPKPPEGQNHRIVTLHKSQDQALGMSITGGKEHGVPILISVLHSDLPASNCGQLYIGDAILSVNGISLKDVTHTEAVDILSSQEGDIKFEVIFLPPEDEEEDGSIADYPYSLKYKLFDEEVDSLASSSNQLVQNGRLSRASIDSIRGSTDNILASPRRSLEPTNTDQLSKFDSTKEEIVALPIQPESNNQEEILQLQPESNNRIDPLTEDNQEAIRLYKSNSEINDKTTPSVHVRKNSSQTESKQLTETLLSNLSPEENLKIKEENLELVNNVDANGDLIVIQKPTLKQDDPNLTENLFNFNY